MTDHVANLEAALGSDRFDAEFEKIKTLSAEDVASIASLFVSRTAKSAPKRESLRRIYSRHLSLVDSANKREWQRGKGAA